MHHVERLSQVTREGLVSDAFIPMVPHAWELLASEDFRAVAFIPTRVTPRRSGPCAEGAFVVTYLSHRLVPLIFIQTRVGGACIPTLRIGLDHRDALHASYAGFLNLYSHHGLGRL